MNKPANFDLPLTVLDSKPFLPLLERDVYNDIQKQVPEGQHNFSPEELGELMAFQFVETYKGHNRWGTYFGPFRAWPAGDGSVTETPSLAMVTPAIIGYWEFRSTEAQHPVLIARYAGLVYEFSKTITGKTAKHTFAKAYIQALLDTVNLQLYKIPLYAIGKLQRALAIAIIFNDADLVSKAKKSIISLQDNIAINDKPGLWGFTFDLLLNGKKQLLNAEEEAVVIRTLEDRMSALIPLDSWATEAAAQRLMNYYATKKQPSEIKRVLQSLENSFTITTKNMPPIQQAHYIEKLYHLYKQFQLNEEAEQLLIRLRQISKGTDKELKSISTALDISKEKMDHYADGILKGATEDVFRKIIIAHVPKLTQTKEELLKLTIEAPLIFLVSKPLVDKKGRKVATIPPYREDPESHLVLHFSDLIRIGTMFLHYVFEEGIQRGIFSIHEIMKFLQQSCLIEPERFIIIQRGLEAYFNKDYITAMHLIIPQFEEAIRNLVEMNGGSILVYKNDAFNVKTFDYLLSDDIVTEVFGEDMTFYFKVLFTDKRGWNLRNEVAHGLLNLHHFNKQNTDRLLHALLCLGMVRYKEN